MVTAAMVAELEQACRRLLDGYEVRVFTDLNRSGKETSKRSGYLEMLRLVASLITSTYPGMPSGVQRVWSGSRAGAASGGAVRSTLDARGDARVGVVSNYYVACTSSPAHRGRGAAPAGLG